MKSTKNVERSFDDSLKELFTIEQFCERMGAVSSLKVVENPQKVNPETGEANIFFSVTTEKGNVTGAVSNKLQKKIREGEKPEEPVIGLFETADGEEVFTMYEQGNADNVLFEF